MGQSKLTKSFARSRLEQFRQTVLLGAERFSRQDIRQLADDLHELARDRAVIEGRLPRRALLEHDSQIVWI